MTSFTLILSIVASVLGVVLASPAFRPTITGKEGVGEVFWFQNDHGVIVPALLHGQAPPHLRLGSKGIADDVKFYVYNRLVLYFLKNHQTYS